MNHRQRDSYRGQAALHGLKLKEPAEEVEIPEEQSAAMSSVLHGFMQQNVTRKTLMAEGRHEEAAAMLRQGSQDDLLQRFDQHVKI